MVAAIPALLVLKSWSDEEWSYLVARFCKTGPPLLAQMFEAVPVHHALHLLLAAYID